MGVSSIAVPSFLGIRRLKPYAYAWSGKGGSVPVPVVDCVEINELS